MPTASLTDRDHGFAALMDMARALSGGAYAKVGILGDDERGGLHEVDPETGKASALTVGEIAVVNEFGTEDRRVPARSFVRSTYDRIRDKLAEDAGKLLLRVADKKMTVEQALDVLGLELATAIRHTITDGAGVPPPNAPATAEAKARGQGERAVAGARPLVDTGRMLNAIGWGVVLGTVTKAHRFLTGRGGAGGRGE